MTDDEDILDAPQGPEDIDELDDEMRNLISQLDDDDISQKLDGDTSPPLQLSPGDKPAEGYREIPAAETLVPQDVCKLDLLPPKSVGDVVVPPPEPPIVDLRKQFEQLDSVTDEIIMAARSDRQEAQDVINIYRSEIDKAINAGHLPSRGYLDNIVKALEVKTTVNMTVVKALEAKSKMMAATKAGGVNVGVNVQNNNSNSSSGSTDQALVDLLSENPLKAHGEDEY